MHQILSKVALLGRPLPLQHHTAELELGPTRRQLCTASALVPAAAARLLSMEAEQQVKTGSKAAQPALQWGWTCNQSNIRGCATQVGQAAQPMGIKPKADCWAPAAAMLPRAVLLSYD